VTIWVKKKIFAEGLEFLHVVFNVVEGHGPVFLSLVFASFLSYNVCKKYLAFPSHVFRSFFVEQQTGRLFIVYEVKIKSNSIYRAEIWEQIAYIGYCDVNTTHESIERQTKYIEQKRDVPH